jgi:hypothetical protein
MGRSILIIIKLSFRKRDVAGHSSLVDQQSHVMKRHQIHSDCVQARKLCKTEQTQKIARAINTRKPGHRCCRNRAPFPPERKPPSID